MFVNVTYDPSTSRAPTGFQACINAVCQYYDAAFTNNITVNVAVGYGEVNGTPLSFNALGESEFQQDTAGYSQVKAALAGQHAPGSNSLPQADPTGGRTLWVTTAEEKALGLIGNSGTTDGWIGFSSFLPFNYQLSQRAVAWQYDFVGVVLHEMSEVMGRISGLGDAFSAASYAPMDLFRYQAAGLRQLSDGSPSYFSTDGGTTRLNGWNNPASGDNGDLGDWAASAGPDAYLDANPSGQANPITLTDLTVMHAIGWTAGSYSVAQLQAFCSAALAIGQPFTAAAVGQLAIADAGRTVAANLDSLQAMVANGIVGAIALTDAATPTLSLAAGQLVADAGALAKIGGAYGLKVTGVAAAAAATTAAMAHVSSITVSDVATAVSANLDGLQALAASGKLTGIGLTDTTTPTLVVSSTQLTTDATALGEIAGTYALSVTGTGSAVTVIGLSSSLQASGLAVADTAANVQSNLDGLQALASAGKLAGVTLTDSGTPTLTVTAAQLAADQAVLKGISGSFMLNVDASAANVTINGLTGHASTAAFTGTANQYTITPVGDGTGVTVTDTGTGRSSSDHLSQVAALRFSDLTDIVASQTPVSGSTISTAQVTELYGAVFGRKPDLGGLSFYQAFATAHPSTRLTQFALWFLHSPEYAGASAHNYAQSPAGDAQFITDSYNNLLHRAPGSGDIAFYQNNVITPMLAGVVPGTVAYTTAAAQAHAQVLAYFSQSPEFLSDVTVTAQSGSSAQHWLVLV